MKRRLAAAAIVAANLAALTACEEEVTTAPPPPPRRVMPIASASASASASATVAPPTLGEAEFTRSDSNRDPFYAFEIKATKTEQVEVKVIALADRFALDDLKLVGIISGATAPKAMFLDPEKKGWIVGYGQFLGRAETVRSGGSNSAEYSLHWKVDRIRDNDVVFIRETPGRPNVPSATKVVSLRTEEQRAAPARR